MKMKISMYELLGMVKDGKAPKKIKYMGYIFEYDTNHKRYESYFDEQIWTLNDFVNVDDNLNDTVKIPNDEDEEKKIPEKLILHTLSNNDSAYFTTLQDFNNRDIQRTINWILDYLKSKGDE